MAETTTNNRNLGAASQGEPSPDTDRRHEPRDVNIGYVLLSVAILVLLGICTDVSMGGLLAEFKRTPATARPELPPIREIHTPAPTLWSFRGPDRMTPEQTDTLMIKQQDRQLQTYGWIDRQRNIVRLPIDRAKELILASPSPAAPLGPPVTARSPENEVRLSAKHGQR